MKATVLGTMCIAGRGKRSLDEGISEELHQRKNFKPSICCREDTVQLNQSILCNNSLVCVEDWDWFVDTEYIC